MTLDSSRFRPSAGTRLLIKAAYHADDTAALEAWREWERSNDFDKASWTDLRIAAVAGRRLRAVGHETVLAPRLAGMRRYLWSSGQTRLAAMRPLLVQLHDAGIPMLLFKGAARIADNPAVIADRFFTDIDVLIPPTHWAKAIDVAFDNGYANVWNLDRDRLANRMRQTHHSIGILAKPQFEVDFHQFSLLLNRQLGADDGLWQRARPGSLSGIPVMLPHPSDRLALLCGHTFLYTQVRSFDWVGDALDAINGVGFDWSVFEQAIQERDLAFPASVLLAFLREEIGTPIPADVLARIAGQVREPFVTELDAYASAFYIDEPAYCRAILAAETIRSRKSVRRTEGRARPASAGEKMGRWHSLASGQNLTLPVPQEVGPDDCLRLDLRVQVAPDAERPEVVVRCFDNFHLEFGRWQPPSWRFWHRFFDAPVFSLEIPGALVIARGVDELKLSARPADRCRIEQGSYRWQLLRSQPVPVAERKGEQERDPWPAQASSPR